MMFSDFNAAFQEEPFFSGEVPTVLQNAIDVDLPEGLTYKEISDGLFAVTSLQGETKLSFKVELPEKAKKLFKEKTPFSSKDVADYLFNSQTVAKIIGDDNSCIVINENKIPIDKVGKYPFSNIDIIGASMFLIPQKMEEEFDLKVGNRTITKKLKMQRKPNESISERKYVSDDSSCFQFTFYVDPNHIEKIRFAFDIHSEKAPSALDIYESYQIMNSICDNEFYINGQYLNMNSTPDIKKVPEKIIKFWGKILELEDYLNLKFVVNKGIREIDAQNIHRLYRCFIQEKPFRIDSDAFYVKGQDLSQEFIEGLNAEKGFDFEFCEEKQLTILGVKVEIIVLAGIYNATVCKEASVFDYENNNYELKFISATDKKIYESVRFFLASEVEVDDSDEVIGHPELLKDATTIDEDDINS